MTSLNLKKTAQSSALQKDDLYMGDNSRPFSTVGSPTPKPSLEEIPQSMEDIYTGAPTTTTAATKNASTKTTKISDNTIIKGDENVKDFGDSTSSQSHPRVGGETKQQHQKHDDYMKMPISVNPQQADPKGKSQRLEACRKIAPSHAIAYLAYDVNKARRPNTAHKLITDSSLKPKSRFGYASNANKQPEKINNKSRGGNDASSMPRRPITSGVVDIASNSITPEVKRSIILSPYVSEFAKTAAQTVPMNNPKGQWNKPSLVETKIVLAPKFGPDSQTSNMSVAFRESFPIKKPPASSFSGMPKDNENHRQSISTNTASTSSTLVNPPEPIEYRSSSPTSRRKSFFDTYPEEKTIWVKEAIQKLIENKTITPQIVNMPGFTAKIGRLYDIAVDKKCNQISTSIKNIIHPTPIELKFAAAGYSGMHPKQIKKTPATPPPSRTNISTTTTPGGKKVKKKASTHQDIALEQKVSDILLHMLLKNILLPPPITDDDKHKKHVGTNTGHSGENDNDNTNSNANANNNNVHEGSHWEAASGGKNCFVFDGKICPVETTKKPQSLFAPLSTSRRKTQPLLTDYFRKISDFRGFEAEEISIKFSRTKIFVEGKQEEKEGKNYRLVREIISLPPNLRICNLNVMRGKNNGKLVFEEI